MSGPTFRHNPNARHIHCDACHQVVGVMRPQMVILRRLTITPAAKSTERTKEQVRITCTCGHVTIIDWILLQR